MAIEYKNRSTDNLLVWNAVQILHISVKLVKKKKTKVLQKKLKCLHAIVAKWTEIDSKN